MIFDSAHNSVRQLKLLEVTQHMQLKQIIYFFTNKKTGHYNIFGTLTVILRVHLCKLR